MIHLIYQFNALKTICSFTLLSSLLISYMCIIWQQKYVFFPISQLHPHREWGTKKYLICLKLNLVYKQEYLIAVRNNPFMYFAIGCTLFCICAIYLMLITFANAFFRFMLYGKWWTFQRAFCLILIKFAFFMFMLCGK